MSVTMTQKQNRALQEILVTASDLQRKAIELDARCMSAEGLGIRVPAEAYPFVLSVDELAPAIHEWVEALNDEINSAEVISEAKMSGRLAASEQKRAAAEGESDEA